MSHKPEKGSATDHQYRQLAVCILKQAYDDVLSLPRFNTLAKRPHGAYHVMLIGYRDVVNDVPSFTQSNWCQVLCAFVELSYDSYKRRMDTLRDRQARTLDNRLSPYPSLTRLSKKSENDSLEIIKHFYTLSPAPKNKLKKLSTLHCQVCGELTGGKVFRLTEEPMCKTLGGETCWSNNGYRQTFGHLECLARERRNQHDL